MASPGSSKMEPKLSLSPLPAESELVPIPAKRKRRQLVACDGCRLRRIKCDAADQKDKQGCSECRKKSIKCTDNYIKNKPKVIRSGKLIEKARVLYGDEPAENQHQRNQSNATTDSVSPTGSPHGAIIRAAEGRFVNHSMALAISNHLIQVYHDMVHVQTPIIDWDYFLQVWDASGRNSDNMSPTAECLALVIQAWAARFSDHPSIVGSSGVQLSDLRTTNGEDFSKFGLIRDQFARAMADRAIRTIDERGALRRASGQSTGALLMLEFLLTWGDPYRSEGRHLMVASVEHLRVLNDGFSDDPTEQSSSVQQKTAGGTLFWMAYTRDAISAAFSGRSTCLTDDDIAVLCEIAVMPMTADPVPFISSPDPRTLCGLAVVSIFRHITNVLRKFTVRISGPLPRRSRLDESAVRELWSDLELSTHYSTLFYEAVETTEWVTQPKSGVWFRDVASMRGQLCHALHRSVVERLDSERATSNSLLPDPEMIQYLNRLSLLKLESEAQFLIVAREMAKLVHGYGVELVFEGGLSCENLPVYLEHMLSILPSEHGGDIESWTVHAKFTESQWLVDGIKLQGFCWPYYNRHIENANAHLIQLKIQAEHDLAQAYPTPRHASESLIYSPHQYQESAMAAQQAQQAHQDGILSHQQVSIPLMPLEYSQQSWGSADSNLSSPAFLYNQNCQVLPTQTQVEFQQYPPHSQQILPQQSSQIFYNSQHGYIPGVKEYSTQLYQE